LAFVRIVLVAALMLAVGASNGCGSRCALALRQRVDFPRDPGAIGEVLCCGASVYRDIDLAVDDIQVDLINSSDSNRRVDAFLTSGDCVNLFNEPYAGTVTASPCTIYLGPVIAGSTGARQAVRRGKYRIFAQGYSSNDAPAQFLMELGLWSDVCRWTPIAP
jgi:hypothetical protein